jgi:hypothetical protein
MLPKTHEQYGQLEGAESYTHSGKLMALHQLLLDCGIGMNSNIWEEGAYCVQIDLNFGWG